MADGCTWAQAKYWPTGNDSTLWQPGCKEWKRSALGHGWKFCPFCGGRLISPAETLPEQGNSSPADQSRSITVTGDL